MLRFTIRDVLWLTVVVALAAAWFVDRRHQERKLQLERNANIEAAAKVQIEWLRRYRGEIPSTPPTAQ
jgi:cell division protein FtsL